MRQSALNRRRFVELAAGTLALGGMALIEACASAGPASAPTPAAPSSNPTQAAAPKPPTAAAAAAPTTAAAPTAVQKPTAGASVSRTVVLPNRYPFEGIKPDLPASADGLIDAAFVNY